MTPFFMKKRRGLKESIREKNREIAMNIVNKNIDGGKAFDWGKTSKDYAKDVSYA